MTDIELVIKIPEEKELIDRAIWYDVSDFDAEDLAIILKAIATATPLPKGHGDLKDIETFKLTYGNDGAYYRFKDIIDAPTIIEADKGDTE